VIPSRRLIGALGVLLALAQGLASGESSGERHSRGAAEVLALGDFDGTTRGVRRSSSFFVFAVVGNGLAEADPSTGPLAYLIECGRGRCVMRDLEQVALSLDERRVVVLRAQDSLGRRLQVAWRPSSRFGTAAPVGEGESAGCRLISTGGYGYSVRYQFDSLGLAGSSVWHSTPSGTFGRWRLRPAVCGINATMALSDVRTEWL
jgi:hypothetical protein